MSPLVPDRGDNSTRLVVVFLEQWIVVTRHSLVSILERKWFSSNKNIKACLSNNFYSPVLLSGSLEPHVTPRNSILSDMADFQMKLLNYNLKLYVKYISFCFLLFESEVRPNLGLGWANFSLNNIPSSFPLYLRYCRYFH